MTSRPRIDSTKRTRDRSATPEKKKRLRGESQEKTQKRVQKYRQEWQDDIRNKKWLRPVSNVPTKAQCILCKSEFTADISVIKAHATGKKHITYVKDIGHSSLLDTFRKHDAKSKVATVLDLKINAAEIKLCGHISAQNFSLRQIDNMTEVYKSAFDDSEIVKGVQLGRTKATSIIQNVVGKCHKEELADALKHAKFSVIIDEGTDVASLKTMSICTRFFDENSRSIQTKFWSLIQIFDGKDAEAANKGATAERLFDELIKSFGDAEIPLRNIIGFASDGCNVMFGQHNSVASRMKELQDGVVVMKCICHSLHLCASEACKMLPRHCEDLARNVYVFFNHSSKRQAEFQEFQEFCNVEPHKLLRPAQTRWLSLLQVVRRVLEQWEPLKLFFISKWMEEKLIAAETLVNELTDDFLKLYYLFLNWVLPKIVKLNEYFQSEKVVITVLHTRMVELLTELLLTYLNPQTVKKTDLNSIKPNDERLFVPLTQMYLGVQVQVKLQEAQIRAEPEKVKNFLCRCRMFMITLCEQIQKRYDFSDSNVASKLACFIPKDALTCDPKRPQSILNLIQQLPCIVSNTDMYLVQNIDDQWRRLPFASFPTEVLNDSIDKAWVTIRDSTDINGEKEFQAIGQFVLDLLVLPHSSASCERVFSKVNLVKTKSRNKLITNTLNGLLLTSQYVQDNGGNKFQPTKQMLESMTSSNLYPTCSTKEKRQEKSTLQNIVQGKENIETQKDDDTEIDIVFDLA